MEIESRPSRRRATIAVSALIVSLGLGATSMTMRGSGRVSYADARSVVDRRCVECHSAHPTSRAFPIAPKGVSLDTAEQMRQYAERIKARVVVDRTMPLANMTSMTDEERRLLGVWVDDGAATR